MDIFDMFFGGGGRGRRERKGKDVVHQLQVTLEELYNGSVRKLALQKNVVCEGCAGECPVSMSLLVTLTDSVVYHRTWRQERCRWALHKLQGHRHASAGSAVRSRNGSADSVHLRRMPRRGWKNQCQRSLQNVFGKEGTKNYTSSPSCVCALDWNCVLSNQLGG